MFNQEYTDVVIQWIQAVKNFENTYKVSYDDYKEQVKQDEQLKTE